MPLMPREPGNGAPALHCSTNIATEGGTDLLSTDQRTLASVKYRREIDGLRALAVIPVIFFHAGFCAFSGGFVGVDVFFVISGYLITSVILADKQAGKFTIASFYERRARRILPALFLVMLVCLPFAWIWLPPSDMKSFSNSVVAVSAFASNVLFWKTSSYFDTASELRPLLHTWSLAVEEQYYLLFPLLLLALLKLGRRWTIGILGAAAILSLVAAQIGSKSYAAFTFYMLPTRGWELLIGVLIALRPSGCGQTPAPRIVSETAGFAGLALIAYPVFAFSSQTPFPSVYALVPTIGTAIIILFSDQTTLVGRLLGHRILVGIGLISYSAYLWHQPLFAFSRHALLSKPSSALLMALSLLAMALAYFSWKYLEMPFRDRSRLSRRQIFRAAVASAAGLMTVGLLGHFSGGFTGRLSPEKAAFLKYFENDPPVQAYFRRAGIFEKYRGDCDFYDLDANLNGHPTDLPRSSIAPTCYRRDPSYPRSVFIWGDSHAEHLYYGLKTNLPKSWQVMQVASSGCPASMDPLSARKRYCTYSNTFAIEAMRAAVPDVVVIGQDSGHDSGTMRALATFLRTIGAKRVIFTGPTPHWTADLPVIIIWRLWDDPSRYTLTGVDRDVLQDDRHLKADFMKTTYSQYVSIIDYFCDKRGCMTHIGKDRALGITSWDHGHLTPIASDALARDVLVPLMLKPTNIAQ